MTTDDGNAKPRTTDDKHDGPQPQREDHRDGQWPTTTDDDKQQDAYNVSPDIAHLMTIHVWNSRMAAHRLPPRQHQDDDDHDAGPPRGNHDHAGMHVSPEITRVPSHYVNVVWGNDVSSALIGWMMSLQWLFRGAASFNNDDNDDEAFNTIDLSGY